MGRPTHVLTVKRKPKNDGDKTVANRIGAGWMNAQGWLSIKLDPCTVLTDREDIYINLYPNEEAGDRQGAQGGGAPGDDIPF